VVRSFTNSNWASDVGLASSGDTTWDDLVVGNSPVDVGLLDYNDADGDGLSKAWEQTYGLDDGDDGSTNPDNGPNGDPDMDGLTNIGEFDGTGIAGFSGGTNPIVADSDGDGLDDGSEVKTHGTDPTDRDMDDDGLNDGDEILTHLTDPKVLDTDGGGTGDFTEVAVGTVPAAGNSADDPESDGDLGLIGIEFFDSYGDGPLAGKNGGTGWDYDNHAGVESFVGHTTLTSDWDNIWGTTNILAGRLATRESGIKREFHGGSGDQAAAFGEITGAFRSDGSRNSDLLYVKFDVTRRAGASWGGCSLYDFWGEKMFIGVPGTQNAGAYTFGIEETGTDNRAFTPVAPAADQTYTIVAMLDFFNAEIKMWVDPVLALGEAANPAGATLLVSFSNMNGTALRFASGGSGQVEWDQIVVGTTWEALSVQPADGDNDGLPGDWETTNGLDDTDDGTTDPDNGPGGDKDKDGLTNLQEFNLGLAANNDDTDNDGLTDGIGESAAGTLPLNPDTDGDGLKDGDEVHGNNPAGHTSNPLVADTDGDGQLDGGEVLGSPSGATSDPDDATDTVGGPIGLIGCDGFFYDDGPVQDRTGGEGFDYENYFGNGPFIGHTGTTSDWDGDAVVAGGKLVTVDDSRADRDYNGPLEGAAEGADARWGAVNQEGDWNASVVYFKAEMTRRAGATASYIVSDDFGGWRMAFGVVDSGGSLQWGIEEFGVGINSTASGPALLDDQTYTVVGKLDFDGDLLSLWVDPDLAGPEAGNPAIVTRPYTNTNWSSGVRLNSKGPGATEWDNVVVANSWEHLRKVITEPAAEVELVANGYNAATGILNLAVNNLLPGDYHLRMSADGQTFVPFSPGIDFTETTSGSIEIPLDIVTNPMMLIQVFDGVSAP